MTGEITLRGKVLPVGGLPEKLSAARRGGIRRVLVPEGNLPDLREVPPEILREVEVVGIASMEEALAAALLGPGRRGRRRG